MAHNEAIIEEMCYQENSVGYNGLTGTSTSYLWHGEVIARETPSAASSCFDTVNLRLSPVWRGNCHVFAGAASWAWDPCIHTGPGHRRVHALFQLSCHHRDVFTNFKPGAPHFRFSPGDASDVASPVSSPVGRWLDSWRIRGIWLDCLPSYVIRNSLCPQGAVPGKWPLCWCFVAHLTSLGLDLLSSDFFVRVATILLPWTLTVGVFAYFLYITKSHIAPATGGPAVSNPDALGNVLLSFALRFSFSCDDSFRS